MSKQNCLLQRTKRTGKFARLSKQFGAAEQAAKESAWFLIISIIVLITSTVLLIGYYTIHIWSDAACTQATTCVICKKTNGEAIGHQWAAANCTTPKICTVCNESEGQALGHDWIEATATAPATCSLCEATTGTRRMPVLGVTNLCWGGEGDPDSDCDNKAAKLSFPSWDTFSQSTITIKDANYAALSPDQFQFEWNNGTVSIMPVEDLSFGIYHITFVCEDGDATISVCYGYEGDIYLEDSGDMGWWDMTFQNWKNKRYLVQTDIGLETTTAYSERTIFPSSDSICGIEIDSDGRAYPVNGQRMAQFTTISYLAFMEAGLFVFQHDGWYLASDASGLVYLSKDFTDECYWAYTP